MKRDLEQEVEELREQKAALIDEIAYKDGQLYELQDAVVSKEIEIEQLKSEVKRQRSTIDRLERTISGLEERLDKAIGNIIETTRELKKKNGIDKDVRESITSGLVQFYEGLRRELAMAERQKKKN